MKKWVTPELLELKAEWTANKINESGTDTWGEHILVGDPEQELDLGSCKP